MSYADNFSFKRRDAWTTTIARQRLVGCFSVRGALQVAALRCRALAQEETKAFFRHRLAEQKALAVVAAHADKGEGVGGLFNADRNHAAAEIVRKVDHRLA